MQKKEDESQRDCVYNANLQLNFCFCLNCWLHNKKICCLLMMFEDGELVGILKDPHTPTHFIPKGMDRRTTPSNQTVVISSGHQFAYCHGSNVNVSIGF